MALFDQHWRPWGISLSLVFVCGCTGTQPSNEWLGSVTDSAGVRMVSNPHDGVWTSETGWTVSEDLRIGAVSDEAGYQFGAIQALNVDTDGILYVLDAQSQEVVVFDREGRLLQTIGGPGAGPGELSRAVADLFVQPDGSLAVADPGNQRVTIIGPEGGSSEGYPLDRRMGLPRSFGMTPDGAILVQIRRIVSQDPNAPPEWNPDPILRLGADSPQPDTVHWLQPGQSFTCCTNGAQTVTLFGAEPLWDLSEEGTFVVAMDDSHRVESFDGSGRLVQVSSRDLTRDPITETDKEAIKGAFRELFERRGMPREQTNSFIDAIRFAEYYPAFLSLLSGPEGTVWLQRPESIEAIVERVRESEDAGMSMGVLGSSDWEVLGGDGRFLGVLRFPDRFIPMKILADHVYGVWRDELNVQFVLRLRLEKPLL